MLASIPTVIGPVMRSNDRPMGSVVRSGGVLMVRGSYTLAAVNTS